MNTVINHINSLLGVSNYTTNWELKFTEIAEIFTEEDKIYYVRVNVEFKKDDFTFNSQIKFHYRNFSTEEQVNAEILRQLQKLEDYTQALTQIETFLTLEVDLQPTSEWKAALISVEIESPLLTKATFIFYYENLPSFYKTFNLSYDMFISFQIYLDELNHILTKLNTPVEVDYSNLITNTNY